MRYFIALEIPEDCRKQLEIIQTELKEIIPNIRLTDNDKLHLTIAFIGEQPDELKDNLIGMIQKATEGISKFQITPAYIDGFPDLHHAHTFWIGVKGDTDKLMVIRERIKDGLNELGLNSDERRYLPHIAIAKATNFKINPDQETKIQAMMMEQLQDIQITSIKLFESIPEEGFHRHNTLAEVPLE